MNGNVMYDMARQRVADQLRVAEQRRVARQAREARRQRATARGRHTEAQAPEATVLPVIPDFADELFDDVARDALPAPRREGAQGDLGRLRK
jgi:hypothetical protein